MQNQSITQDFLKIDENINVELSLKSNSDCFKDTVWFNLNPHKSGNNLIQSNVVKRGVRSSDTPSKRWGHSSMINKQSMLIFGGRHSHRSLVNIFSLNFNILSWTKVEPIGQTPPARDSHSALVYKNDIIAFGGSGSGKKLNDLWGFNLESKKWSKINSSGELPCPREGHSSAMIRKTYMMIYGGLNENDQNISDIYLLDLRNNIWYKAISRGDEPSLRDSQSCTQINNTCYIFGGQGENDKLYNDIYSLDFEINESEKKFTAKWAIEDVQGRRPPARTSHSATSYKSQFLFIIAGEGYAESKTLFNFSDGVDKLPLNDVWIYSLLSKIWSEIKVKNSSIFEGRMCHSATIFGDRIFVYGGMKNADTTFETLTILCLDGKTDDLEEASFNYNFNSAEEMNKNFEKVKGYLNSSNNGSSRDNNEYMFVSNNLNIAPNTNTTIEKKYLSNVDVAVDTSDLHEDDSFNFENLKKNYLNNMISWSFLKKLSDFNQWPLGCISNFVENSLKEEVEAKNIMIDAKCFDKKVYTSSNKDFSKLNDINDFSEKVIVLTIIDDGTGIKSKDFNQILYSFSINEKKEYNFFRYGVSMKASAIRLANSFLLITKTDCEASVGLISKNLQIKLDTDFILTPIVNFKIDIENGAKKYLPRSNFAMQSLKLILNEIKFMFREEVDFIQYLDSFKTGTHIFLYDLKQISGNKNEVNKLSNYELLFDVENNDIIFNYFAIQVCDRNYIDCSLSLYLKFLFLKSSFINVSLLGKKIPISNPLTSIYNVSRNIPEVTKIHSNLKCDLKSTNCVYIEGEIYRGMMFNEKFYNSLSTSNNFNFENSLNENEMFNGILVYRNNRLVCRFGQNNFGDIAYFIKKYMKNVTGDMINILPICGYIEVPSSIYEILYNKMEFKDQAIYALLYSKIKNILNKINS